MIDLNASRNLAARLRAGCLIVVLIVFMLPVLCASAGVVLTTLHSFQASTNGAYPYGGLVQGSDGYFYGTTTQGGMYGYGTVFKISITGVLTRLYSFSGGNDGAFPYAGLAQGTDGNFYGTTVAGGTNNIGTVFKISTNGALTSLYSFTGNDGANPEAGLVQGNDGDFYGTTVNGGTGGYYGTVFKISTNGEMTTLYSFTLLYGGFEVSGYPYAGLVQGSDGNFYGTTKGEPYAGNNLGSVFKISTNGVLTTLGIIPQTYAGLVQGSDGNFYGTTPGYGQGTVFQISTNGSQMTLHSFGYTDGSQPFAGLVQGSDGNFYGTTRYGGTGGGYNGYGTVFQISTNGTLTSLYSFTGTNDGANPEAGLVQGSDGNFYGTTVNGGTSGRGTVFQITTNGVLTTLYSFPGGNDGAHPEAPLVQGRDGNFYGTTYGGGTNSIGTVFQMSSSGALTSLYSFTGTNDGAYPQAGLIQGRDGNFYGTTYGGGTNGAGTVFQISTNGALASLYSFTGTNDGANPYAGLVQGSDGNFYGTTESGGVYTNQYGQSQGTVFKISANGAFTSLYSFSGTNDGANPSASLVLGSDGSFYGTTASGGTNNFGTVFRITTNGALTSLYSFSGTNDGAKPKAELIQGSDGNFYGTTTYGGTNGGSRGYGNNGSGTVFQITTNGVLTSLYSFTGGVGRNGVLPNGLVQGSDGNFYGTTGNGGTSNVGSVFLISTNGAFTGLYSFTGGNDGANPVAGLVQGSDGSFYGTTSTGGGNGAAGTVFRLTIQPQLSMTVSGANVILSWPTNYAGWYLQKTVNLGAAGFVRITLQGPPVIVNGQFVVTLPITSDQPGYYRLSSP